MADKNDYKEEIITEETTTEETISEGTTTKKTTTKKTTTKKTPAEEDVNYDDVRSGAIISYMAYFSYVNDLIHSIGKEKALEVMAQSNTKRGEKAGKEMREQLGGKDLSVKETMETIVEMAKGIGGMDTVLGFDECHAKTVTPFGKCPTYEAGKAIGMSDEDIETVCRASSLPFLNSVVEQLNPNLRYLVTGFRSEKEQGCVEEIVIEDRKK